MALGAKDLLYSRQREAPSFPVSFILSRGKYLHASSRLFTACGRHQLSSSSTHLEGGLQSPLLLPSVLSSSTRPLFKKKKKRFTEVLYNQFQPDLSLVYVLVAKSSSYFSTSFVWRRAAEQRCTVSLSPAFWV